MIPRDVPTPFERDALNAPTAQDGLSPREIERPVLEIADNKTGCVPGGESSGSVVSILDLS